MDGRKEKVKRLFVAMKYTCDQNEPSKPAKQLLAIEDNRIEQELLAYAKAELTEPDEFDGDIRLDTTWTDYADYMATYDCVESIRFTEVTL